MKIVLKKVIEEGIGEAVVTRIRSVDFNVINGVGTIRVVSSRRDTASGNEELKRYYYVEDLNADLSIEEVFRKIQKMVDKGADGRVWQFLKKYAVDVTKEINDNAIEWREDEIEEPIRG